jgi:exopolysaccharide production protein ExoQ
LNAALERRHFGRALRGWIETMATHSYGPRSHPRRIAATAQNPLLEYLPDILFGAILFFMSMSKTAFGLGPIPAMTWIGCTGLLMVYRRADLGATFFRWWPLLLAPLLALLSFTWSELPDISARYGFQVLLTAFVGVFIARTLPPHRFALAMFVGMFVFCLLSIASGRQGAAATGQVLIGLTGSKNAMAFCATMLLASAMATMFLPRVAPIMRVMAFIGAGVGAFIVATTDSASAVVLSFVAAAMFIGMCVMQRFSPAGRVATILVGVLLLSPMAFATHEIDEGVATFTRDVLHKDPSLTGRTYLWDIADELIARKPFLGYGFQAMWMGESTETIGILRLTGQADGRAFNFHHTYRQVAVDIGLIGAGILVVTIFAALLSGVRQFVATPMVATSFVFTLLLMALAKSFTELIFVAFSPHTMVFFACLAYAFWRPPTAHPRPQQPARRGMRPMASAR